PLRVTARPLDHRVPTLGWRFEEPARVHLVPDVLAHRGVAGEDAGRLLRDGAVGVDGRVVHLDEGSERRPGRSVAVGMDPWVGAQAGGLAEGGALIVCEATFLEPEVHLAREFGHLTAR